MESPINILSQLIETISTSLGVDKIGEHIENRKNFKIKRKTDSKEKDDSDNNEDEDYVAVDGSSVYPRCSQSKEHVCSHAGDDICNNQFFSI